MSALHSKRRNMQCHWGNHIYVALSDQLWNIAQYIMVGIQGRESVNTFYRTERVNGEDWKIPTASKRI